MGDLAVDFQEFKDKVELLFGPLERLAAEHPDIYAHQVLSHGFIEYSEAAHLHTHIQEMIAGTAEAFAVALRGPDTPWKRQCQDAYAEQLKSAYLSWARAHSLPHDLLEAGWNKYLED